MIIEIPDENSIIKWKYKDTDDWTIAEVSDLIKAYEERRPKGEWLDSGVTAEGIPVFMCSICRRQIVSNCLPKSRNIRYPFCNCGADMRSENKFQDLVVFDDQPKRQLGDPYCHNEL